MSNKETGSLFSGGALGAMLGVIAQREAVSSYVATREEIEKLAGDAFDKSRIVSSLEIQNTPIDREDARKASIELAVAKHERAIAESLLRKAMATAEYVKYEPPVPIFSPDIDANPMR